MNEQGFWRYVKTGLEGAGFHLERITERLRPGVPDVLWLHRATGKVGWIELKHVRKAPGGQGKYALGVRSDQSAFLASWARFGGRGAILVRVGGEKRIQHVLTGAQAHLGWARSVTSGDLDWQGVLDLATATWGPRIDWGQLRDVLLQDNSPAAGLAGGRECAYIAGCAGEGPAFDRNGLGISS